MENDNVSSESNQAAPAMAAPQKRSGWRIAAGVLVCIFTLLVAAVLLFLSICFGFVLKSSPSSYGSDAPWIYGLFLVTILVPIGGVWLAVRLFRGPKRARAAGAEAAAPAAVLTPAVPAEEAEQRLAYLRLAILVAILANAALLALSFSRYRGTSYIFPIVPAILGFVFHQTPYAIMLLGIRNRGERWALSLACMYPILALCFAMFSFLGILGPWRSGMVIGAALLLHYLLSVAIDIAVLVFAWRSWQAGRTTDDAVQLAVAGMASAFYLFILQIITPFFYRLVKF